MFKNRAEDEKAKQAKIILAQLETETMAQKIVEDIFILGDEVFEELLYKSEIAFDNFGTNGARISGNSVVESSAIKPESAIDNFSTQIPNGAMFSQNSYAEFLAIKPESAIDIIAEGPAMSHSNFSSMSSLRAANNNDKVSLYIPEIDIDNVSTQIANGTMEREDTNKPETEMQDSTKSLRNLRLIETQSLHDLSIDLVKDELDFPNHFSKTLDNFPELPEKSLGSILGPTTLTPKESEYGLDKTLKVAESVLSFFSVNSSKSD
jgi:hypothetical protein